MTSPYVQSVNVGAVKTIEWRGERVTTGIWKSPASGRVRLVGVNFVGDDQADRTVHGGPDKAVYAYASEDYDFWKGAEHFNVEPALFGENLTTRGIDLSSAQPGEQWTVGTTILEVVQPRLPCYKLGIRVDDPHFLKRFMLAGRPGAYLRILQEGDIGAGDRIEVIARPTHRVTMRSMVASLRNIENARELREVSYLPKYLRGVANNA